MREWEGGEGEVTCLSLTEGCGQYGQYHLIFGGLGQPYGKVQSRQVLVVWNADNSLVAVHKPIPRGVVNGNYILESLMATLAFFLWEEGGVWFVVRGVVCSKVCNKGCGL